MTGKVLQGFFPAGRPKLPAPAPVAQSKAAPRPPGLHGPGAAARPPAAQARMPGPPLPAAAAKPSVAQAHGSSDVFQVDPAQLGLASGGGRPLPDGVRGKMEAALGADFSAVRVHVGPQAERIGAQAFTLGNDVYFAPGRFQPDSVAGQQLLGHELAHVVQQRVGRVRNPLGAGVVVVQDRLLEAEADRLGLRAAAHQSPAQMKAAPARASGPVQISPPVAIRNGSHRITAASGGREIGTVTVSAAAGASVDVTDLSVDPRHRGRGIGKMLLASAARTGQHSGKSKLTLAAQDTGSGRLKQWYKDLGFSQTGADNRGRPRMEASIGQLVAQRTIFDTTVARPVNMVTSPLDSQSPSRTTMQGKVVADLGTASRSARSGARPATPSATLQAMQQERGGKQNRGGRGRARGQPGVQGGGGRGRAQNLAPPQNLGGQGRGQYAQQPLGRGQGNPQVPLPVQLPQPTGAGPTNAVAIRQELAKYQQVPRQVGEHIVTIGITDRDDGGVQKEFDEKVVAFGAKARVLVLKSVDDILQVDGLFIPGGMADLPGTLGAPDELLRLDRKNQDYWLARAELQRQLIQRALALNIPILGVCGGSRSMATSIGGQTRYLNEQQTKAHNLFFGSPWQKAHKVRIRGNSMLGRILLGHLYRKQAEIEPQNADITVTVNSMHWAQAQFPQDMHVKVLVTGSDESDNTVIESWEVPGHAFFLAVQWHPEFAQYPVHHFLNANQQHARIMASLGDAAAENFAAKQLQKHLRMLLVQRFMGPIQACKKRVKSLQNETNDLVTSVFQPYLTALQHCHVLYKKLCVFRSNPDLVILAGLVKQMIQQIWRLADADKALLPEEKQKMENLDPL